MFILNLFECLIILKMDSFVKSLSGLVDLSLGERIFLPLKFPDIILIHLLPYIQYLYEKNHYPNLIILLN